MGTLHYRQMWNNVGGGGGEHEQTIHRDIEILNFTSHQLSGQSVRPQHTGCSM